jgi:hypothetical protein
MKMTGTRSLFILLPLALMLSGCTGVRYSYESLLNTHYDKPVIEQA